MSSNRFWKNAAVNHRRPARRTTPLRVERLETRDLPSAPVPPDIVSWYRAEGDATDFVGDNDGTLLHGTTFTAGKVGQAFLFDGEDDQVSVPNSPNLNPTTAVTLEAWVNPQALTKAHNTVIAKSVVGLGQRSYGMWVTSDGRVHVEPSSSATSFADTAAGVVPLNTWTHVAAVITSAVGYRIYVNGVEQSITSTGSLPTLLATTVPVTIGNSDPGTHDWLFAGRIDEAGIYNRALSAAEIQSIVDAGSEGKEVPDDYDAAGDFSLAGNPNGAWSYGWSASLGGAFTKDIVTRSDHPAPGLQSWDGPISSFFPVISKNTTNATVVVSTVTWLPGQMVNHPGPNGEYSVLRWTAPIAGEVEVSASFSGADSTTTDVHVLFNETTIAGCDGNVNGFGPGPTCSPTLVVKIGDTIDFVVGIGNGSYSNDSTGMDAQITYVDIDPPPTPKSDLSVSITDDPDPVLIGDSVTYTVTATNHGSADATGVVVVLRGPAGQSFNSVTIPVGGLPSGASSSFQLAVTPPAMGTFSVTADVTASEDDPNLTDNSFTATTQIGPRSTFELVQAQYEVREGEPFAVLTVRRAGDLASSGSVEFSTVNGTATQRGIRSGLSRIDDFTTTSGELFFRSHSNVANIRVPIGDDRTLEPDETFRVVLSNPSAGTALGPMPAAEVIIHDNDPTVSFFAASSEHNERNTSRGTIEVRLTPASTQTVTVVYAVSGSATAGLDYNVSGSSLTFRPGEWRKFISFTGVNDTLYEGDETAIIELSSPTNAFLGSQTRHSVTIVDNDPQPPPVEPGSTPDTALFIDLQTLPRQSFRDVLASTVGDKDTFRVHLGAGERLAVDVDPEPIKVGQQVLFPGVVSSTLVVLAPDKVTELARIGRSAEPDTGVVTNNAATLFTATMAGDYYVRLEAPAGIAGYRLEFHRVGVSENVPAPELLNVAGPMYAWFDGVDTVGITGPTGYGFTLKGPWQQIVTGGHSVRKSQTLTLPSGSQFTLHSPQGFDLPLIANGKIVIQTKAQRWGDFVGEVKTTAIEFPVELGIAPINDLLAEAFGSDVSVGVLRADWRISLGGRVVAGAHGDKTEDIAPFLAGVPYLRQKSPVTISAQIGEYEFDYPIEEDNPIEVVFDPGDPMLYLGAETIQNLRKPALGLSRHGLLEFIRQRDPDADLLEEFDHGSDVAPDFFGHVYVSGSVPFKVWFVPFEAHGDSVYNLDADRDGQILAGLFDGDDLFRGNFDDLPNSRDILRDIQAGNNGLLLIKPESEDAKIKYAVHAGEATWVFNGPGESFWFRGQRGTGGSLFDGTPLNFLNVRSTDVLEAMVHSDGHFVLRSTASFGVPEPDGSSELEFEVTISNEGITAMVTGTREWTASIDYGAGTVKGKAIATITAEIAIEIDDGNVHLSGSITAEGKLVAKINGQKKKLFDDSISAHVGGKGFGFDFPLGAGSFEVEFF